MSDKYLDIEGLKTLVGQVKQGLVTQEERNRWNNIKPGGDSSIEITKEEYDKLTEEEKANGDYYIVDWAVGGSGSGNSGSRGNEWTGTRAEYEDIKANLADDTVVYITDDYESNICSTVEDCSNSKNVDDIAGASAVKELSDNLAQRYFVSLKTQADLDALLTKMNIVGESAVAYCATEVSNILSCGKNTSSMKGTITCVSNNLFDCIFHSGTGDKIFTLRYNKANPTASTVYYLPTTKVYP